MIVRELIEELKKLDQEKGIWVFYDDDGIYGAYPPIPYREVRAKEASFFNKRDMDMKEGDYVI